MKPKLLLGLALVLSGGLFVGCAVVKEHSASMSNPTDAENFISEIQMFDASNGWAQTGNPDDFRVLHTTDGGETWADVTPHPLPDKVWNCKFAKAQMAWISCYDKQAFWLLTTNGGKSWSPWKPLGAFDNDIHNYFLGDTECRFFNSKDGLATTINVGACQAVYDFFETHDGGMTWKPASLLQPGDYSANVPPGSTIQISDCDGSAVSYYPPRTIVIANGDLADETPKGVVRLSVSTDAGKSWRDLSLPLPDKYRDELVDSWSPYFSDANNALLPVRVFKQNTNDSQTCNATIFYATSDGGETWTPKPGIIECDIGGNERQLDILSARDIFICGGGNLYVTHDGAQSWRRIKPNIDFDRTSTHGGVSQIDFVDATHGWAVLYDTFKDFPHDKYFLCKTSDGGKTWTELPLKIFKQP